MNNLLWLVEGDLRDRMLRRGSVFCFFIYLMLALMTSHFPVQNKQVFSYALWVLLCISLLRGMTCELSELKRTESLIVTPGFVRNLRWGALQCVGFVAIFSALASAVMRDWLPLLSTVYAGLVFTCLQLPDWVSVRQEKLKPVSLKSLAQSGVSWPFLLALILPAVCLTWLPRPFVLVGLGLACLLGLILLPVCWPGLVGRAARTLHGNMLVRPSLDVILTAMFLLLSPIINNGGNVSSNSGLLLMLLSMAGLGAIARESISLRPLLGQLWLLGKRRDELWRIGMWRLFVAVFPEYALYLACLVFLYVQGWIASAFPLLIVCFVSHAALVWHKGMREVVLGTSLEIISGLTSLNWLFFPWIVLVSFLSIWLEKRDIVDVWLISVLCALPVVVWIPLHLRRDFRRFQTADL